MSRKSTLSPESGAVIRHLKAHGRSTVAALRPHFTAMSRAQLVRRLDSLVALGWLEFGWTEAGDKTWCIRSSARAIPVHTTEPEEPPAALRSSSSSTSNILYLLLSEFTEISSGI